MRSLKVLFGAFVRGVVGTAAVWASSACVQEEVHLGMSQRDVVHVLGQPDRQAVLVGKVLQDPRELKPEEVAQHRLVYIYDHSGLQVWFANGKVTGMTRDGVPVNP